MALQHEGAHPHIGVDAESGLVHADAGYTGVDKRAEIIEAQQDGDIRKDVKWHVAAKRGLIKANAGKKIFLILDNLGVHHCKPVKAWVAANSDKLEVFYLPSYSPELNPEERLNADLKHVIRSKVPVRTKAKLQAAATDHMTALQTKPERVKSFFQDRFVKYAA